MSTAQALRSLRDSLPRSQRMPVVFLGHGSPMHVIQDTQFSRAWTDLGRGLPRPAAILVVSAHWMTQGTTLVDISATPRTIHDFYGFPAPLYDIQYPAQGHPEMAQEVISLLASHHAEGDDRWGLDHGSWAILKFMYPEADVPVFQLSIDMSQDLDWHLEIGATLSDLRDRGVLILGSGNVVHNLRAMQADAAPRDFAVAFDSLFADRLRDRDFAALTDRAALGSLLREAHPSIDHYLPALTVAGASSKADTLTFLTEEIDLSSLSMRSFVYH